MRQDIAEINIAIEEVLLKIQAAENFFENTSEPDLIEASIYKIKSLRAEYSHLYKLAKNASKECVEI